MRFYCYISHGTRAETPDSLLSLVQDASAFNKLNNITGVLVYANGKFGQLIEGEPAGIEITVERIRQSRRHKSLLVIGEGATRQRLFPQWSLQLEADPALLRSTLQALNKGHDYSAEHVDCAERMLRLVAWERDGATSQP